MDRLETLRQAAVTHRPLLRDLLLILVSCLVCFLYFNEQWYNQSTAQRQQALNAFAAQLADSSYVPLASNNLVSLNVLAHEAIAQPPVVGVRIEQLDQTTASSAGAQQGAMQAVAAVGDDEQKIIGRVVVIAEPVAPLPRWTFVLLLICLLGLRVALTFFWQQLLPMSMKAWRERGQPNTSAPVVEAEVPVLSLPQLEARLDVSVVDFERLQQRYTPQAFAQLLGCYDDLLQRVAGVYGVECAQPLTASAVLTLRHTSADEVVFLLTCCARLFIAGCERLNQQRHQQGESCLSFRLLLSSDAPDELREPLLQKSAAQQLNVLLSDVPESLSARMETHLLEQWQDHDVQWQLLAQTGLAERYQKLMVSQLDSLGV